MVGMASKHIFKFEGSIDVANLFIEASQISFFSGLFVMHIGDLTPISCVIPIHFYILDKCVCVCVRACFQQQQKVGGCKFDWSLDRALLGGALLVLTFCHLYIVENIVRNDVIYKTLN